MRTIKLPASAISHILTTPPQGRGNWIIPVEVNWPELRLTESQMLANAAWSASGGHGPRPFPNLCIFDVEIPMVPELLAVIKGIVISS